MKAPGLFFVLLCIFILPLVAYAQTPERTEEFVYATTQFNGSGYRSALVPPQAGTIYLIAGVQNILAPRRTQLYYWPITNRYLADWAVENKLVEGQLEIFQYGKKIALIELSDYVVQSDSSDTEEANALYIGEAAQAAYVHFQELQKKYRDDLYAYYQAQDVYRKQVDEIVRNAVQSGKTVSEADFPKPPTPVPPLSLFSREVAQGYALSLPVGTYTIQMRLPDGSIPHASRKTLVTFEKMQDGVAYTIVPQSRWTEPESSSQPEGVIYTPRGTTLYLQPFRQSQYNDFYYTRMADPQDQSGRRDRTRWVPFEPYQDATLRLEVPNLAVREIPLEAYFVQQLPGSGLGYEVVKFDPASMPEPSFEGYKLELTADNAECHIQLVNAKGELIAGSGRQIRVLYTHRAWSLYALSALPLLIGFGMIIERRRRIRKIKVDE